MLPDISVSSKPLLAFGGASDVLDLDDDVVASDVLFCLAFSALLEVVGTFAVVLLPKSSLVCFDGFSSPAVSEDRLTAIFENNNHEQS